MSQIAERTGIGRATLYKYFADADAILAAWHERQVQAHLQQLMALRERGGGRAPEPRLMPAPRNPAAVRNSGFARLYTRMTLRERPELVEHRRELQMAEIAQSSMPRSARSGR